MSTPTMTDIDDTPDGIPDDAHERIMKRLRVQANFALWSVSRGEMLALANIIEGQRAQIELYKAQTIQHTLRRELMVEILKCVGVVAFFAVMTIANWS